MTERIREISSSCGWHTTMDLTKTFLCSWDEVKVRLWTLPLRKNMLKNQRFVWVNVLRITTIARLRLRHDCLRTGLNAGLNRTFYKMKVIFTGSIWLLQRHSTRRYTFCTTILRVFSSERSRRGKRTTQCQKTRWCLKYQQFCFHCGFFCRMKAVENCCWTLKLVGSDPRVMVGIRANAERIVTAVTKIVEYGHHTFVRKNITKFTQMNISGKHLWSNNWHSMPSCAVWRRSGCSREKFCHTLQVTGESPDCNEGSAYLQERCM